MSRHWRTLCDERACTLAAVKMRAAALMIAAVVGLAPIACTEAPEHVIVNRSGRTIAFAPGVVVPPCQSVELTRRQVSAARAEAKRWFREESDPLGWVPPDTVHFQRGVMGAPIGAPNPLSLVITSEAEPQVVHGFVPTDLPPCGGEPMGID